MNERDKFIADVFRVPPTEIDQDWVRKYITDNPDAMRIAWDTCMIQWKLNPLRYKP